VTTPPVTTAPVTTPPVTTPPDMGPVDAEPPAGDDVSFDQDVHPILVEKCGMCHEGVAPALPDHGAADLDVAFAATQTVSNDEPVYMRILSRVSGDDPIGGMPPGCGGPPGSPGCLTPDEYEILELWVEQGATR
jgi:hypothetical protein